MNTNRSKRNQSKRKKRNQMRRSNCRYSGSLSKYERPYCPSGWDFIAEKDAKIIGKLADNEKLCTSIKSPYYYKLISKDPYKDEHTWVINADRDGYNMEGYSILYGFDREGYNRDGYDREGYDREGYNREGYNIYGLDREGYNIYGLDREGYNRDGYDREGYNRDGYDREGYNREGYNIKGKSKHIKFVQLTRTPSNDEAPLRGDGPGNTHYFANYSTTVPERLTGPQFFTTDAEIKYAKSDPKNKKPRPYGPGKRLLKDINKEWNVI